MYEELGLERPTEEEKFDVYKEYNMLRPGEDGYDEYNMWIGLPGDDDYIGDNPDENEFTEESKTDDDGEPDEEMKLLMEKEDDLKKIILL